MTTTDLLSQGYERHVKPVLALNNELRQLTSAEHDINTATIVALGDQSHGKSSVIEALSGVQLPRGEGMKTKLPLSLHLREAESDDEYAMIGVNGEDPRRVGLADVAAEIDRFTNEIVGEGVCDIKDNEIELTVFRKGQTNLDLIDLPGVTRAVADDTPANIEERIVMMYERFMTPKEAVLLNVVAAQTDTSTSKAFSMSLELDAGRHRTLLCLTKVDSFEGNPNRLAERVKKDAEQFRLQEKHVFCVRNRTPEETESGVSLDTAARDESDLFDGALGQALDGRAGLGRAMLADRLAKIQRERIVDTLPAVLEKARARLDEYHTKLRQLPPLHETPIECLDALQNALTAATDDLRESRTGFSETRPVGQVVDFRLRVGDEGNQEYEDSHASFQFKAKWNGRFSQTIQKVKMFLECSVSGEEPFAASAWMARVLSPGEGSLLPLKSISISTAKRKCFSSRVFSNSFSTTIDFQLHVSEEQALSCAQFAQLRSNFAHRVRNVRREDDFFSQIYFEHVKSIHETHRGHVGLPDSAMPHVAVREARRLQNELYPFAKEFAESVEKAAKKWTKETLRRRLKGFNNLVRQSCDAVDHLFEDASTSLEVHLKMAEMCFDEVILEDHYYSSLVSDLDEKVRQVSDPDSSEEKLGFLSKAKVQLMSNFEQGVVRELVRLCAYWKAMVKEFTGHITRLVKVHLFSETIEKKIRSEILSLALNKGIDEFYSRFGPSKQQREEREDMQVRFDSMQQAVSKCEALWETLEENSSALSK